MKKRSYIVFPVCTLIVLLLLPANIGLAIGPGQPNGNLGLNDTYWKAWPGWSVVYDHNDVDETTWMTGVSFWNVEFKDVLMGQNNFVYWVKEATIPWIAIDWNIHGLIVYEHAPLNNNNVIMEKIQFNGLPVDAQGNFNGFFDSNNQPNQPSYLKADYELYISNANNPDFQFEEMIELHGDRFGPDNTAYVVMTTAILARPANWQVTFLSDNIQDTVNSISIAYISDPDVFGNQNGIIHTFNNGLWISQNNECSGTSNVCDQWGRCAMIGTPGLYYCAMKALADGHSSDNYYGLRAHGNEYSQFPSSYNNNENVQNQDDQLWYVETFSIANNPPALNALLGVQFSGFRYIAN